MRARFTAPLIPLFIVLACGPKGQSTESDGTDGETTTGGTSDAPTGTTTGETPTGTTTGETPTGTTTRGTDDAPTGTTTDATTGTDTGDDGQPILCDGGSIMASCFEVCVRDVDPQTPMVDANCRGIEQRADMSSVEVPQCIVVADQWATPEGAEACFAVLTDKSGKDTPGTLDDMSNECVSAGHNAEIFLVRNVPPMAGACAFVTCEPSLKVMSDCPNL